MMHDEDSIPARPLFAMGFTAALTLAALAWSLSLSVMMAAFALRNTDTQISFVMSGKTASITLQHQPPSAP